MISSIRMDYEYRPKCTVKEGWSAESDSLADPIASCQTRFNYVSRGIITRWWTYRWSRRRRRPEIWVLSFVDACLTLTLLTDGCTVYFCVSRRRCYSCYRAAHGVGTVGRRWIMHRIVMCTHISVTGVCARAHTKEEAIDRCSPTCTSTMQSARVRLCHVRLYMCGYTPCGNITAVSLNIDSLVISVNVCSVSFFTIRHSHNRFNHFPRRTLLIMTSRRDPTR